MAYPNALQTLTTLTVQKQGGTATADVTQRQNGDIVFTDAAGREQIASSNTWATKLYAALTGLDA